MIPLESIHIALNLYNRFAQFYSQKIPHTVLLILQRDLETV